MRSFQFDPFGEPLHSELATDAVQSRTSKLVLRLGVGVFWSLVAGIVAARIAYFDPNFVKSIGTFAANNFHGFFPS